MKWLKGLLGLETPLEKKKKMLSKMRHQAMGAQRNGNIKMFASLSKEIEDLENEILQQLMS